MAEPMEATPAPTASDTQASSASTAPARAPIEADKPADANPEALAIEAKVAQLQSQISETEAKIADIRGQLKKPPEETIKRHIKLLHDYNEMRDIATGLIGMIADQRGVRLRDCLAEFGVEGEGD